MREKGFQDTKEQQFQELVERCERIEKMILKMGDERRSYCQNRNEMIRFSCQSAPELESNVNESDLMQDIELVNNDTQPSLVMFESQV